jgi:hypothetical protein
LQLVAHATGANERLLITGSNLFPHPCPDTLVDRSTSLSTDDSSGNWNQGRELTHEARNFLIGSLVATLNSPDLKVDNVAIERNRGVSDG